MSWRNIEFSQLITDSAFGPRFSGDAYDSQGNIATLRTTDISTDGYIQKDTMPLARLEEHKFRQHFLQVGDLVITRSGRVGTCAVFDGFYLPVLPGAFLIRFRLGPECSSRFYRYWFNSGVGQQRLQSVAKGAAQQNISATGVKSLQVPFPPIEKQNAIVKILSAYDDLIESNRRRITLLERAARLLYREWFVHLRFPGHEAAKIVDGLPEGWTKTTVGAHCPLIYGKALKADTRIKGSVDVYGSSGIVGTHNKALVIGPVIIVGRKGNVGSIYWARRGCWPIDTVYFVDRSNSDLFTYFTLQHITFQSTDVAVPGLNRDYAHGREIKMPTMTLVQSFNDRASVFLRQTELLSSQNDALTRARDLLLPRLMDGRILV